MSKDIPSGFIKPEFVGIFFRCLWKNKTGICGILALVVLKDVAHLELHLLDND